MIRGFTLVFGLSLSFYASVPTHAAAPAPAAPNLKKLPIQKICSAPNVRYMLARSIIDAYGISAKMLDWNDDGMLDAGRIVSQDLCSGKRTPAQNVKCYGDKPQDGLYNSLSADGDAQGRMVLEVAEYFRSLRGSGRDINISSDSGTLRFRKVRDVTPIDVQRQPILGAKDNYSVAGEIFSSAPEFYEMSCQLAPSKSQAPAAGKLSIPSTASVASATLVVSPAAVEAVLDRFRIRGKTDDLWIGRNQSAFAGVWGASVALSNDQQAHKQNFDAHLVVGYAFPSFQSGEAGATLIPYLKYDRDYIDGVMPTSANNVNNFAGGLQSRVTFPIGEEFYSALIFQTQYAESLRTGAQVVSVRLAYEPEPLVPFLGFIAETPIPDLWATAYARGVTNYYEVLRNASDGSLTPNKNFWHGGGQVGGALVFRDGTFAGLSIPVDYTYLYGISGPFKSVELLQVAANYTLPKTKYVTVGLSYTSGRNLDTFENQKIYKASLGFKY